jgi:aspartyl-tRNA(Asn)/glutamyl-tRNA(Gln) amidotransferase subunit C
MSHRLSREDVERIAALAHLELTPEEADLFTRQLADILGYAERLQTVDTTGAPPTWHGNEAPLPLRDDTVRPSLSRDDTLANAPDGVSTPAAHGGFFRVPRVIG